MNNKNVHEQQNVVNGKGKDEIIIQSGLRIYCAGCTNTKPDKKEEGHI